MPDPFITDAGVVIAANPTRDVTVYAQGTAFPDAADILGACVARAGDAACFVVGFSGFYQPVPDAAKTAAAAAKIINRLPLYTKYSLHLLLDIESARNVFNTDPLHTSQGALLDATEGWCQGVETTLQNAGVDATYHGRVTAAAMQSLLNTITADFFS